LRKKEKEKKERKGVVSRSNSILYEKKKGKERGTSRPISPMEGKKSQSRKGGKKKKKKIYGGKALLFALRI